MAKSWQRRVTDTRDWFFRSDNIVPLEFRKYHAVISDYLREPNQQLRVTQQFSESMSFGTTGSSTTRQYRRAILLIMGLASDIPLTRARVHVDAIHDARLPEMLGKTMREAIDVLGPRLMDPYRVQLLATPGAFLANHRIKLGGKREAEEMDYCFYKNQNNQYQLNPSADQVVAPNVKIRAFNVPVQDFNTLGNLGQIDGAAITGSIALTTELSNCTILFSVNGPDLVAAHIMPTGISRSVPDEWATAATAFASSGALQAIVLSERGGFRNPVQDNGSRVFGIYGKVNTDAHIGWVGPPQGAERFYGYNDDGPMGRAYFLAFKKDGTWQLFVQQNNRALPEAGVAHFAQIYP